MTKTTALTSWAQLVRLPNVFTVVADVSAAFLLVAGGPYPVTRMVCVVAAGVALYWAGMVLNDVFDAVKDSLERPTRPIPAGLIPVGQAKRAGWLLLAVGVGLAACSGYLPADDAPSTWLPAAVAVALAAMVVAYDGPLKQTPLAPAAMGSCRVLSFLLGAAPLLAAVEGEPWFPKYIVAIAFGFGVYVMGITTMGRHEATGGVSTNLWTGVGVTAIGGVMLAFAPSLAVNPIGWSISPQRDFPFLIAMITLPVVLRGIGAARDPRPRRIQTTIKVGVLTIIPLAAAFAFLGAGPLWGIAVFSLTAFSIALAIRFRVT